MASILATYRTDAFSSSSSEPRSPLGGSSPAVPTLGQVTKCLWQFATWHLYRTNLCELAVGRGLDSCVFRQPVFVQAFLPEHLTGKHARLAGKTFPEAYPWAPSQIPPEAPISLSESGPSSGANTLPSLKFPYYLRRRSGVLRVTSFLTLCTMSSA